MDPLWPEQGGPRVPQLRQKPPGLVPADHTGLLEPGPKSQSGATLAQAFPGLVALSCQVGAVVGLQRISADSVERLLETMPGMGRCPRLLGFRDGCGSGINGRRSGVTQYHGLMKQYLTYVKVVAIKLSDTINY